MVGIFIILGYYYYYKKKNLKFGDTLWETCDILDAIALLLEMTTFFLVVKLMLPITPSEKEKRSKFQSFLFKGFADKNELKAAVLANNPDMNKDQRSIVESDLDKLCDFIETSASTRTIVGGMVEVVDMQDFAFMGTWRYNPRK